MQSNKDQEEVVKKGPKEWKTFHKKAKRDIASYTSTKKELSDIKVDRRSKPPVDTRIYPIRDGRRLSGPKAFDYTSTEIEISFMNDINNDWEHLAGENLLRFQPKDTKLFIKKGSSLILLKNKKARYAEEVLVTYLMPNGNQYSYNALIDSSNGNVMKTWNRTRHEFYVDKGLKFSPF